MSNNDPKNKIPFLGSLRPMEMIGIGLVLFALMVWGLSKCGRDKKSDKKNTTEIQNGTESNLEDGKTDALRRTLYVCMDSLRMRRAPHKDSATVKLLPYGDELMDMGEYQNEQTIKMSPEYSVTEPWIKVKTKDGRSGWVFGAGVRPYPKKRPLAEETEKKSEKEEKNEKVNKDEKTSSESKEKNSSKNVNKKPEKKDK